MLFPNNNSFRPKGSCVLLYGILLYIAAVLLPGSCKNFINLELIGFSIYPAADNTVLPEAKTALSVHFNTPMDREATQKALSVHSPGGTVRGDIFWQNEKLIFTPLEPWLPGVRYTMNLQGTLYARDGREDRVSRHVAFYALTREAAPHVLVFTPADGSSVGVNSTDGAFVQIVFSRPMDCQSVIDSFHIEGVSEVDFYWSSDDTVMEVHPKNNLNPWTVYRWSVSSKARGKNGVPLGREAEGRFVTDRDRILPLVTEVFPLVKGSAASGLWWIKTGAPMENGFGSGQAIGIEFNKPMDESVLRSIRFDPPLSGRTEMWKPDTVVFIPDRDPEPERIYTLFVSADSRDTGGLKMEKEFSFVFTPDIPCLGIRSMNAGFGETTPVQNGIYSAVTIPPEGITTITIRFSHALTSQAQAAAVLALRLEIYFPGTLRPVSFRSARWWSADTVVLQWEGIEQGTAAEKKYYRLVLPGGRNGISDGKGSYLKEDTIFFLNIENGGT